MVYYMHVLGIMCVDQNRLYSYLFLIVHKTSHSQAHENMPPVPIPLPQFLRL